MTKNISRKASVSRRSPKAGIEVPISPGRVIVFKPSAILKQRINGLRAVGVRE
jgi:integration host factor subunit alpha